MSIARFHIEGDWVRMCVLQDKQHKTYKEHTELYKISKFDDNRANIGQDTAVQKREH